MHHEHHSRPVRARTAPRVAADQRCSCCGSRLVLRARQDDTVVCAECRETAKAYDANDPYDELGEGD